MGPARNLVATLVIGVVAGTAPFLFMQLLPALLDPAQPLIQPNYAAVIVTGVLVGAICAIVFARGFEAREP